MTTTLVNLAEVHYALLREGIADSRHIIARISPDVMDPSIDDWLTAAEYKLAHRSENVSLVDSLGYILAQRHRLKFLTGDMKFKGKANVEYVK